MCSVFRWIIWIIKYFIVLPLAVFGALRLAQEYPSLVTSIQLFFRVTYGILYALVNHFPFRIFWDWDTLTWKVEI